MNRRRPGLQIDVGNSKAGIRGRLDKMKELEARLAIEERKVVESLELKSPPGDVFQFSL